MSSSFVVVDQGDVNVPRPHIFALRTEHDAPDAVRSHGPLAPAIPLRRVQPVGRLCQFLLVALQTLAGCGPRSLGMRPETGYGNG